MKSIRTDIFHLFPTCYRVVISYEKGLIKHEGGKKTKRFCLWSIFGEAFVRATVVAHKFLRRSKQRLVAHWNPVRRFQFSTRFFPCAFVFPFLSIGVASWFSETRRKDATETRIVDLQERPNFTLELFSSRCPISIYRQPRRVLLAERFLVNRAAYCKYEYFGILGNVNSRRSVF